MREANVAIVLHGRVENLNGHRLRSGEVISESQFGMSADRTRWRYGDANELSATVATRHALRHAPKRTGGRALSEFEVARPILVFRSSVECGQQDDAIREWFWFGRQRWIVGEEDHVVDEHPILRRLGGLPREELEIIHALAVVE